MIVDQFQANVRNRTLRVPAWVSRPPDCQIRNPGPFALGKRFML